MSPPTDPNGSQMKRWLPPIWYNDASSVDALLESEGEGLTQFQTDTAQVNSARMPQTAPEWGLERFEMELGLSVNPPGMALEDRRARILARFRGIGATIYRLKQVAGTWAMGNIAILPGIEDWTLYMQFIDVRGVPSGLDAHELEIRNNVEAHLDLVWAYHFTLWQEVLNTGVLWCQLMQPGAGGTGPGGAITWDDLKTMPYQNLPTTLSCGVQPTGTMTIEVIDQTGLGNMSLRYATVNVNGRAAIQPAPDVVVFPLD